MNVNEYGQVTFLDNEIIDMLYAGQNIDQCVFENQSKHHEFSSHFDINPALSHIDIIEFPDKYHNIKANNWLMPTQYKTMDLEKHLAEKLVSKNLATNEYTQRLLNELDEFKSRNMIDVLKFLCYLMDCCKQNEIITGIGRGSSVSSLVLHLLEVHHIDPVKYNLNYKEFLR